jgi:GNAT superfamily N-acetyltransferase
LKRFSLNNDTASELVISPFQPLDQAAVKDLILAGMAEHWIILDPARNMDLNNISMSYADAVFLVARLRGEIVGTGALVPHEAGIAEIVRMSVSANIRRSGIGRQILEHLVQRAKNLGFRRIILETTATWDGAINFYQNYGFRITHYSGDDVYLALDLVCEE